MNIPQYVTQLTREWIRSVSKRTVQGSFIRIDETDDNRTISVDVDQLKRYGSLGFVDTSTAQTVGGQKTFSSFIKTPFIRLTGGQYCEIISGDDFAQGSYLSLSTTASDRHGFFYLCARKDAELGYTLTGNSQTGTLSWSGNTTDTTDTDSTQLPKLGYLNDKFIRKTAIGQSGGVASFSHDHGNTYAQKTHSHTTAEISNWGAATDQFITTTSIGDYGYVTSQSLTSTLSNYATAEQLSTVTISIQTILDQLDAIDIGTITSEIEEYATAKKNSIEAELDTKAQGIYDNLDGYVTAQELEDLEDDIEDLFVQKTSLYEGDTKLFVDTSTAQTVGGQKTFVSFIKAPFIRLTGGQCCEIISGDDFTKGSYLSMSTTASDRQGFFYLCARKNAELGYTLTGNSQTGTLSWSGNTTDTTDTDSTQLPKLGYLNDKFIRKTAIGQLGGVAAYSHTHAYAAANHNHSGVYAQNTHSHTTAEISNWGAATDQFVTKTSIGDYGYVTSQSLTSTLSNYATAEQLLTVTNSIQTILDQLDAIDIGTITSEIEEYATAKKNSIEAELDTKAQGIYDNLDSYVTVDGFNDLIDEIIEDYGILTSTAPSADEATAAVGSSTESARADHKHPIETPTAATAYTPLGDTSGEGGLSTNDTTYTTPGGASGRGCRVRVHTRTYYDHTASSPVLYGYFRMLTFNQFGRLVSVSAETRYEIDTPTVVEAS